MQQVDVMISDAVDRAMADASRHAADSVVWEELDAQMADNARLTGAFLAFLILATQWLPAATRRRRPIRR